MNEQAKKATKRRRRWLKVSLRTFLLAITVLCVWLGFIVNRANKQKQAVAWVREHGGTVYYDFEFYKENSEFPYKDAEPPGPDWLRKWIGIDYFADVTYVSLCDEQITDLGPLANLIELRILDLGGTQPSDLWPLAKMKQMQVLNLSQIQVSDLSPLSGMRKMRRLSLNNTPVSDLSPLSDLTELRQLEANFTQVSDLTPLSGMPELQQLCLYGTPITDLMPLRGITHLNLIELSDSDVSDLTPLGGMWQVTIVLNRKQQVTIPPEMEPQVIRR